MLWSWGADEGFIWDAGIILMVNGRNGDWDGVDFGKIRDEMSMFIVKACGWREVVHRQLQQG